MKNRQRALLYPYNRELCPLVRHEKIISDFEIVSAISPNSWGMVGEDAGTIDGGSPIGIIIENDFDKGLSLCDTVILSNDYKPLDFDDIIYPKIEKAVAKGKNIVCIGSYDAGILDKIQALCSIKGTKFIRYLPEDSIDSYDYANVLVMEKITTPVIFVLGLSEKNYKFEIQLSMREQLTNMGYRVSQIGSRNYCELFGFHSFPQFMYSKKINETGKVKLFNNYVKKIEVEEKPDVIVIGIPGAIMKINDKATNDFGILAFEVSQALKPDAAILSVTYEDYQPVFFERIMMQMKYKFGYEIDCFNIASTMIDWGKLDESGDLRFITLELDLITKKVKELNANKIPIFNVLQENERLNMANFIIDRLAAEEFQVI